MKFSIEIWPFDPINVIPSLVTSILIVDKTGIAFFELIARLVIFNDCRNKFFINRKMNHGISFILFIFIIRRLIVIVGCVKICGKASLV